MLFAAASAPPPPMPIIVGFAVLIVAFTFGGLWLAARRGGVGSVPPRPVFDKAAPTEPPAAVVRVGASVNGIHCSWPIATVQLWRERLELTMPLADTVAIHRTEVTEIRTSWLSLGRTIRFVDSAERLHHVIVRTGPGDSRLLTELHENGWPIRPQ